MGAALNKEDVFPDDLIQAPLQYVKGLEAAIKSEEKLIETAMKREKTLKGTDSIMKVVKETKELSLEQKELVKVQQQIAVAQVKASDTYKVYANQLAEVKKQTKANNDNNKVSAGSYDELNKQVKEAAKQLKAMEGSLNGNNKQINDLKKVVSEGTEKLKAWDKEMGDSRRNVGNYEDGFKGLKDEFKAARAEMVAIGTTLGTESPEFLAAAEKAGVLKDEIEDIQKAAKNVSGSKLENLSATFKDSFGKLASGDFKGALESAKQFANVSKSISFKEAGKSVKEFGSTIGTLGKAILTNPLFLIGAAIAGLIYLMFKFRDSIKPVKIVMDVLGDAFDFVVQKIKDFTDYIGLTTFALDEHRKKVEENALKEVEAVKKQYDTQIKLAQAAGEETFAIEKQKWIDIRDAAQAAYKNLNKDDEKYKENVEKLNADILESAIELRILEVQAAKRAEEEKERLFKEKLDRRKKFEDDYNKMRDANVKAEEQRQKRLAELFNPTKQKNDQELLIELSKKYNLSLEEQKHIREQIQPLIDETNAKLKQAQNLKDIANYTAQAQKIYSQFASNIGTLFNNLSNQRIANLDYELRKLDNQTSREIELAGNNDAAKKAIEEKAEIRRQILEKKRLDEQQRIAKLNKAIAIAQAVINTAQGVTAALAEYPPNLVLAAIVGALGASEVAAISSQPIPKYEKGTSNALGGLAIVGEKGAELVREPSGKAWLTPEFTSLRHLPKGAEVIPHDETMRMLALSSFGTEMYVAKQNDELLQEVRELRKSNQDVIAAIYANGINLEQEGTTLLNWHKDASGNRSTIKKKSMGYE